MSNATKQNLLHLVAKVVLLGASVYKPVLADNHLLWLLQVLDYQLIVKSLRSQTSAVATIYSLNYYFKYYNVICVKSL